MCRFCSHEARAAAQPDHHQCRRDRAQGEMLHEYRKPQNSVPATGVRRNPICRRFFSGAALGAKFEVVVRVASAIEVTLRHHRVAFRAIMFVNHRRLRLKSARRYCG